MKTIALFFGGPSNEHEVSVNSAKNIYKNLDRKKYRPILVYWTKAGEFFIVKDINKLNVGRQRLRIEDFRRHFAVAFPITHGRFGEDGVLQAILESQKIKYCGCRVLSSALCMDKAVFKEFLRDKKIRQVPFIVLDFAAMTPAEIKKNLAAIKRDLSWPLFVKPANSGSSVGITKVNNFKNLARAINLARRHDSKVIIEKGLVNPREMEVAVLGNKELIVSRPGELKPGQEFYDYDDKYKLGLAKAIIPAKLPARQTAEIRKLAARVYGLCDCQGFARVDFFIHKNQIYLNEINSLPGFTNISMYPMLMKSQGVSYKGLLNKIIKLAY